MAARSNASGRTPRTAAFERPSSSSEWKKALGRKVSLRYRLRDDPDHPFSEAVGFVQSVDDSGGSTVVSIVNKRGEITRIALQDVEAAKLFPSTPAG
ncbi:MAG: hypothetical protein M3198_00975 [Actinomycetota bacterium]|nr:hypothetical protein [Actinomycetota bacterium]